ncbi:MAG: hypothetical protein J6A25_00565 [Lachnospiraceae bacterium]|nr:hypothetical protein [Lachnospiraceae bacterium]
MLIFKKVTLHNFGSYAHAEFDLQERGFCLVSGQNNFKKDNALSNGSGKSFIWNAVSFALLGETLQGISSNLKNINATENSSYVKLEFSYNRDSYEITRFIAPKSDLHIIKNGVNTSGKGVRESEKKFAELLPELTKDLLASVILIGQGMPNRFSSYTPTGRKALLEKLTKSDFMFEDIKNRLSDRLDKLKAKDKEYADSLLSLSTEIRVIESSYNRHIAERDGIKIPDFLVEINKLTEELTKIEQELAQNLTQKTVLETNSEALNSNLLQATTEKSEALQNCTLSYNAKKSELTNKLIEYKTGISVCESKLKELKSKTGACPTCGQQMPNSEQLFLKIQEQEIELKQNTIKLQEQNQLVKNCEETYNNYVAEINSYFDTTINDYKEQLLSIKTQIATYTATINKLTTDKELITGQIAKLQHDQNHLQNYLDKLNSIIKQEAADLNRLKAAHQLSTDGKEQQGKHLKKSKEMDNCAKNSFRAFLLKHVIDRLNEKSKDYCEIVFETRELDIELSGNNLNITYCGKVFDSLSGGEKQRVDLILQFALRQILIEYLNFNSNIIVLDEITDFLDKKSCAAVMRLLEKELNTIESVFIISHHAETLDLPIDSEIHIIKNEQGISEVF